MRLCLQRNNIDFGVNDRMLSYLPLAHIFDRCVWHAGLMVGRMGLKQWWSWGHVQALRWGTAPAIHHHQPLFQHGCP